MASISPLAVGFVALFLFKYLRLFVNLLALYLYRPIPPTPENEPRSGTAQASSDRFEKRSRLTPDDVSVVIAALDPGCASLRRFIPTCLATGARAVYVVTIDSELATANSVLLPLSPRIRIRTIGRANKRRQIAAVLPEIDTKIVILADDDVVWPPTLLPWILAPFDADSRIGGVQTCQRTIRPAGGTTVWDFLNAQYLIRRNFDCTACVQVDYGLPCLSGRTAAYRASVIQTDACLDGLVNETWAGRILNADDDNYFTRWLVSHGWRQWIQNHPDCEVLTTLEQRRKFYSQCLRWSRSNWRSNIRSLVTEATVWTTHPWATFAVFQTTITSWAPLYDFCLNWMCWSLTSGLSPATRLAARVGVLVWSLWLCRAIKYVDHCRRYRHDIRYLVALPLIAYVHAIGVKLWAMLTLHETTWGSREGTDTYHLGQSISLSDGAKTRQSRRGVEVGEDAGDYDGVTPTIPVAAETVPAGHVLSSPWAHPLSAAVLTRRVSQKMAERVYPSGRAGLFPSATTGCEMPAGASAITV